MTLRRCLGATPPRFAVPVHVPEVLCGHVERALASLREPLPTPVSVSRTGRFHSLFVFTVSGYNEVDVHAMKAGMEQVRPVSNADAHAALAAHHL